MSDLTECPECGGPMVGSGDDIRCVECGLTLDDAAVEEGLQDGMIFDEDLDLESGVLGEEQGGDW